MRVLQINTTVNSGSTGRIAEDLGKVLMARGHESYIAYGRGNRPSSSSVIKIGGKKDIFMHGVLTALFDRHGFGSNRATECLLDDIERINPDVIALHNLHGYYLNIEVLFRYLSASNRPVVWTLYDCWPFTGHCTYFDDIQCERWIHGCFSCPKKRRYPSSHFIDNSRQNYLEKKEIFRSCLTLSIVVHSKWLARLVDHSFLGDYPVNVIRSGIDTNVFKPFNSNIKEMLGISGKKMILGCASIWDRRKGLSDFVEINTQLNSDEVVVLLGLTSKQIKDLPKGMIGIPRTESITELAALYSAADVFVNPTFQDNFPTTNLEALACATPVITYDTGGSPEAIGTDTGFVVRKGDVSSLYEKIQEVIGKGKDHYAEACRNRAICNFNKDDRYSDYIELFKNILEN